jgi:hypothetical protein
MADDGDQHLPDDLHRGSAATSPTGYLMRETEDQFIRRWSERAYDQSQLAALAAIYENLIDYSLNGWRSMEILPPRGVTLICACDEGLQLMTLSPLGDWRTNAGQPHKVPHAWMPAPILPLRPINGGPAIT